MNAIPCSYYPVEGKERKEGRQTAGGRGAPRRVCTRQGARTALTRPPSGPPAKPWFYCRRWWVQMSFSGILRPAFRKKFAREVCTHQEKPFEKPTKPWVLRRGGDRGVGALRKGTPVCTSSPSLTCSEREVVRFVPLVLHVVLHLQTRTGSLRLCSRSFFIEAPPWRCEGIGAPLKMEQWFSRVIRRDPQLARLETQWTKPSWSGRGGRTVRSGGRMDFESRGASYLVTLGKLPDISESHDLICKMRIISFQGCLQD